MQIVSSLTFHTAEVTDECFGVFRCFLSVSDTNSKARLGLAPSYTVDTPNESDYFCLVAEDWSRISEIYYISKSRVRKIGCH